ncbi:hypothetical protein [Thomasclavelia sp.]|uniref:hypothetical protein n=1 Tax=Thomasclavelia sp. TaxID=3025757 RepID=UPI0025CC9298|nr:hypothetical protein [Thomasclavelia sp.]
MMDKKGNIGVDDIVDDELFEKNTQNLTKLITEMAEMITFYDKKTDEKPIYHFSKDKYYLDVFENKIKFCGYCFEINDENEVEGKIIRFSEINYIIAENHVLKIYLDNIIYIIPNLSHLIKIEYILSDYINKYKSKQEDILNGN